MRIGSSAQLIKYNELKNIIKLHKYKNILYKISKFETMQKVRQNINIGVSRKEGRKTTKGQSVNIFCLSHSKEKLYKEVANFILN